MLTKHFHSLQQATCPHEYRAFGGYCARQLLSVHWLIKSVRLVEPQISVNVVATCLSLRSFERACYLIEPQICRNVVATGLSFRYF